MSTFTLYVKTFLRHSTPSSKFWFTFYLVTLLLSIGTTGVTLYGVFGQGESVSLLYFIYLVVMYHSYRRIYEFVEATHFVVEEKRKAFEKLLEKIKD